MPIRNYKIPIPIPEKEGTEHNITKKESQMLYWTCPFSIPMGEDLPLPLPSHPSSPFHVLSLLACHYDLRIFSSFISLLSFSFFLPFLSNFSVSVSFSVFDHDQQSKRIPIQKEKKIKLSV